jgi:hypothetical protein
VVFFAVVVLAGCFLVVFFFFGISWTSASSPRAGGRVPLTSRGRAHGRAGGRVCTRRSVCGRTGRVEGMGL